MTIVVPPFGASSSGFGPPTPWNAGGPVRQHELRRVRVQADQHAVRPQRERVGDDVLAHRQVDRAVGVDRLLQRGRVVGRPVAARAERARVHPGVAGRQRREVGRDGARAARRPATRRTRSSSRRGRRGPRSAGRARTPSRRRSRRAPRAAARSPGRARTSATPRQATFSMLICVRGLSSRLTITAGPVTFSKRASFTKRSSGRPGFDLDRGRHVPELRPDEREAGRLLADGGPPLALEAGVEQRCTASPATACRSRCRTRRRRSARPRPRCRPRARPARPEPIRNSTCDVKQCWAYFARTPTAPGFPSPISRSTLLSAE